jgi:hypothetical protein
VAVAVTEPADPGRYFAVRGRVLRGGTEGAVEHVEALSQRYLGGPYPWYGGRDEVRVLLTIGVEKVHAMG